jgi:single-stranded DNA-binding protein
MACLNKVFLIGEVGVHPELEILPDVFPLCTLKLLTWQQWTDANTQSRSRAYEWIVVQVFGKLGEAAYQHLKQGSQIYLEGSLYTYYWDVGAKLYESYPVLIASTIKFLGDGDGDKHFPLDDMRPPPTRPYSSLPSVRSSVVDRASKNYFDQKANLIQLFAGTREATNGQEKHFRRVIEGSAQPSTAKERTWLKIWDFWKSKLLARHSKTAPEHECEDCGCEIPKERFAAVPDATRCVACQTKFEGMTDLRIKAPEGWHGIHRPGSSYKDQD